MNNKLVTKILNTQVELKEPLILNKLWIKFDTHN